MATINVKPERLCLHVQILREELYIYADNNIGIGKLVTLKEMDKECLMNGNHIEIPLQSFIKVEVEND